MKKNRPQKETVLSSEYTEEYYKTSCDGFYEFNISKGTTLPKRLQIPLDVAKISPGDVVLDIGCGRGELLYHSAKAGAYAFGIDYSTAAIKIASDNLSTFGENEIKKISIYIADAKNLPVQSESVDFVFMLDVVEHLYPYELDEVYHEILRVLRKEGKLIIHTMPNLWYYRIGYPLFRMIQKINGVPLPKNPRDRWPYIHVHVNEQTPFSLWSFLRNKGFEIKVWLETTQNYDNYEVNKFIRVGMKLLTNWFPFNYLFCNDIFAVCTKMRRRN